MTTVSHSRKIAVATVISRIFDPFLVFGFTALFGIVKVSFAPNPQKLANLVILLVSIAIPFVLLSWAVAKKKVANWYISDRRERPLALLILLILTLTDILVIARLGDRLLLALFEVFLLWLVGFLVITLFWKISGHTGSLTLASFLFTHWLGWPGYILVAFIPVVAWSRVIRRDHTLAQVTGGIFYSALVVETAVRLGIFQGGVVMISL